MTGRQTGSCGRTGERCGNEVWHGGANELHSQYKLSSDLLEMSGQCTPQETFLK